MVMWPTKLCSLNEYCDPTFHAIGSSAFETCGVDLVSRGLEGGEDVEKKITPRNKGNSYHQLFDRLMCI